MDKKTLIIIGLVALLVIVGIWQFSKPSVTGNVVKEPETPIYSSDLNFKAFWRDTNPTCNQAMDRTDGKVAELSFTYSNTKELRERCKIFVDKKTTTVTIYGTEGVTRGDNAYLGQFDALKNHNVKICCGDVCKESYVSALCSDEDIKTNVGGDCSWDGDCKSDYCVHNICRSSSTYCGDDYCDPRESYSSCSQDCENPSLFEIGDSNFNTGDTLSKLDENYYKVMEAHTGDTVGTINFPLLFNREARDVEFEIGCYDVNDLGRLDSRPNEYDPKGDIRDAIIEDDKSLGFMAYFGYGSADPFILTNNKDFGTQVEYINKGGARVLIFPSSNWGSTREFKCTLTVIGHDPPEREQKEFKLRFT